MAGKKDGGAKKPRKLSPASATEALLKAVNAGDLDGVKLALAAGADVHARSDGGIGAIHYACHGPEILRAMPVAGADPDARADPGGLTPPMAASRDGRGDVARTLLELGADVNAATEYEMFVYHGKTALAFAREARHEAVVATRVDRGGVVLDLEARKSNRKGGPTLLNRPG